MSQKINLLFKALMALIKRPQHWLVLFKTLKTFGFNANALKQQIYLLAHSAAKISSPDYAHIKVAQGSLLLITHELSNTGAPKALCLLAKVLQQANYQLVLISPSDGPMRQGFEALHIPVIIDQQLLLEGYADAFVAFAQKFKLVVVNTIVCAPVIKMLDHKVNTLWWLHEGKTIQEFIEHTRLYVYKETLCKAKNIYIVSAYAKTYLDHYNPQAKIMELGIPDQCPARAQQTLPTQPKIIFSMVGAITHKKGFDILVDTIKALPASYQERAQFNLIGKANDADFFKTLNKTMSKLPCIRYLGPMEHPQVLEVLAETDVLLCISRDDSFPLVTIEAWMCGVPCILSKAVGTSKYIISGKNGFIIDNAQPHELTELLGKIIDHPEDLIELRKEARNTYLNHFSLKEFTNRWLAEFNHILTMKS